jgi:GrpB-like predicted nucleotidyltransferase (UPF0157 family)
MQVEIVAYDPQWPDRFRQIAQPMRAALGEAVLRIDHIGSTAIPGAGAKPIIDVQIAVQSFDSFDTIRLPLEALGYVWRADNPDLTKRYFREAHGTRRTHIHVRRVGSWPEQLALLFRDYMRQHPDDVRLYTDLKRDLAGRYQDDRQGYTDAKGPFVWQIMAKADRWSQVVGWQSGPSDV